MNPSKSATRNVTQKSKGLLEGERASIKARVQELKADKANGESAVLAAIAKMPAPYRAMGKRLHALITASAPALAPKTWYGLPAYARFSAHCWL